MSRIGNDQYVEVETPNGIELQLFNGYDYVHQAWVINGVYVRCGHPDSMGCDCYGREHVGTAPQPGLLDGSAKVEAPAL